MANALPRTKDLTDAFGFLSGSVHRIGDRDADAGLFGPRSVTWKVMREKVLVVAAGRALLLQVAHPAIAQGVIDHSDIGTKKMWARFISTADWVAAMAFGTTAETERSAALVDELHLRVRGSIPASNATDRPGATSGARYSARNHTLSRWVHATLIDTFLVSYERLVGPLPVKQQNAFVREWNVVGRRMGLLQSEEFHTRAQLGDYIAHELTAGSAVPGAGSRHVAQILLTAPRGIPQGVWRTMSLVSVGLLPRAARDELHLTWSRGDDIAMRSLMTGARYGIRLLPSPIRFAPDYLWAKRRISAGRPAAVR
jgi:uncharacterized protein (DUF2236 family)